MNSLLRALLDYARNDLRNIRQFRAKLVIRTVAPRPHLNQAHEMLQFEVVIQFILLVEGERTAFSCVEQELDSCHGFRGRSPRCNGPGIGAAYDKIDDFFIHACHWNVVYLNYCECANPCILSAAMGSGRTPTCCKLQNSQAEAFNLGGRVLVCLWGV